MITYSVLHAITVETHLWSYDVLKMLRQMPQPLKTFYFSSFAIFLIGMVIVAVLDRGDWIQFVILPFGLLMALSGLVMALDFRGNATEYSRQLREYKPVGVNYSGSSLGSVKGVRLLGVGIFIVGFFLAIGVPLVS